MREKRCELWGWRRAGQRATSILSSSGLTCRLLTLLCGWVEGGNIYCPSSKDHGSCFFQPEELRLLQNSRGSRLLAEPEREGGTTSSAIPSLILANRLIPFPHNQRPSGSQRAANHAGGRGSVRSCSGVSDADMQAANLPAGEHMQARQAKAARGVISKPFCLGS